VRAISFIVMVAASTVAACESAGDVYAELHPALVAQVARIDAVGDAIRLAPPPAGEITLPVAGPPPRFCPLSDCDSRNGDGLAINARVVQLMDLDVPAPGPMAGPVPVAGRAQWLTYARALAGGTVDPGGRPLEAWYAPSLREMLGRTLDLRYLLVLRGGVVLDRWVALHRTPGHLPLRMADEQATDPEHEADTFVDGRIAGEVFLAELPSATILGGFTFEVSTDDLADGDDPAYPQRDLPRLRTELARAARRQVREALARLIAGGPLPFEPSGEISLLR
jgi:hypothetical protein